MTPLHISTDVLVIGMGGAGLRAAIEVHQRGQRVVLVGKRPKTDAHTVLAAGGINAALGTLDAEDSWMMHAADTLREGCYLGDPNAVEILCREAPRAIEELIAYGLPFAREPDGRVSQRYFGAHRYRRTCYVGDHIGQEIVRALLGEVERRAIPLIEGACITELLTANGCVNGATGFLPDSGRELVIHAAAVILATGGHTHIYQCSTSRSGENTGDGMALALRAGAQLADMELVQFHPSGMLWPEELAGRLVTEAVRGEGGWLFNEHGERFMTRYDAQRMELSTRDRVALANYTEINAGRGTPRGGVWLDVSHLPAAIVQKNLPHICAQFAEVGVDITREPMEIAPTAHYSMGGIRVHTDSHATTVAGLYAVGEVAAGVHGANRLGGNSLAEIIVFGRIAGEHASRHAARQAVPPLDQAALSSAQDRFARFSRLDGATQRSLSVEVQKVMWQGVGVVRDEAGLNTALQQLAAISQRAGKNCSDSPDVHAAFNLRAMLLSGEATVRAALLRTESRGAHRRSDYPDSEPDWLRSILVVPDLATGGDQPGLTLTTAAIPAPSAQIKAALREEYDTVEGLLE